MMKIFLRRRDLLSADDTAAPANDARTVAAKAERVPTNRLPGECAARRAEFSAYLDGEMTGVAMQTMAVHLDGCSDCAGEFAGWRAAQQTLAGMRATTNSPADLNARIHTALALEVARGSHRSLPQRLAATWLKTAEPLALRVGAASLAAMALLTLVSLLPGAPVQANDEMRGAMTAPRYLYSQAAEVPVVTAQDAPLLIEAAVDAQGKVYDYKVLSGPTDAQTLRRVETSLVFSVFQPATMFGNPVSGRVVLTYAGISVRS
jgi:negative regulator of sigma E activity